MKTNLLYWNDDLNYVELKDRLDANFQYYPHETDLDFWVFLEAWGLHILQIGLIGPFVWLFTLLTKKRINWFTNMEFMGSSSGYILTLLIWGVNFMIAWARWYWDYEAFDIGYLFVPIVSLIVRSGSIAAKYASFSPRYRARLQGMTLTEEEIKEHMMLGGWSEQDHHFAETEIYNSMMRSNIDDSTFKVAFMTDLSRPAKEILDEVKHANQAIGESQVETSFGSTIYYDCKAVLYSLTNYHEKTRRRDWVYMVYIVFGLLQAFSSGWSRAIAGFPFAGTRGLEVLFFYTGCILYSMVCIYINIFFLTAYYDYDRVAFTLEQLSQMYSPDKISTIDDKVFPTINLADAVSLNSWINMRKVVMRYGEQYFNRHKIFTSLLLLVCVVSGIFLIVCSWAASSMEFNQVPEGLFMMVGPASIIFVFYGKMYLFMVRKFQLINLLSDNHQELIRDNQQIFQTFHHFRDFYIGESKDKELPYKIKDIFTSEESESFVHHKMASECKRLLNGKDHIANEYIEKLVGLQDEFLRQIKKEDICFAKTVLGYRVDFATLSITFLVYVIVVVSSFVNHWMNRI